jgi:hypothetical protein
MYSSIRKWILGYAGLFLIVSFSQAEGFPLLFPIYDGSFEYVTMRQSDTLYTSIYSLASETLYRAFPDVNIENISIVPWLNFLVTYMICVPITHEEAHRAILTAQNIGSVSQPILNTKWAAYVKGVTDATLQELRDTDFPVFIRLHTAGIESDYVLLQRDVELMALELDSDTSLDMGRPPSEVKVKVLFMDYLSRFLSIYPYLNSGVTDSLYEQLGLSTSNPIDKEESNELERDIVGHDVYGMIHHLFEPTAQYQRYIEYNEMTDAEKEFSLRIGLRSYINWIDLISLLILQRYNVSLSDSLLISGSTGYCIAPFGDFIDENIYLRIHDICLAVYARQYENRAHWFPAFGVQLVSYYPVDWLHITAGGHFWIQPEGLDFNTAVGKVGGAGELELQFLLPTASQSGLDGFGFSLGFLYKTAGFMPEIESHDSDFRISAGLVVRR